MVFIVKNTKLQSASQITLTLILGAGLATGLAWYYDVFVHWQPKVYPFVLAALFVGVLALTLLTLWVRGERKASPLIWKSLLSFAAFGVSIGLATFIINNVIGGSARAKNAASVALPLAAAQMQFAKLSPAHEEEYLRRASAMLEVFRAKLEYDEDGNITQ